VKLIGVCKGGLTMDGINGFSRDQLKESFNKVHDPVNWKNPIMAMVDVNDLSLTCSAIAFFVGDYPSVEQCSDDHSKYIVSSPGYYNIIGA
jgi:hypothetical protein